MPSFRLATVLWAFALLAAAMATFGPWGLLLAIGVFLFWANAFSKTGLTIAECLVLAAVIGLLVGLLMPAVQASGSSHRTARCLNNIHNVAAALLAHEHDHGEFPVAGDSAVTSWRLQLLPSLDQQKLFEQYRRDEPWNSPANKPLADQPIDAYQCPSDVRLSETSPHTSYFAVVDPRTAWPPGGGRRLADFKDGTDCTILLIEAPGHDESWAEPRDLSFDEAVALLTEPPPNPDASPVHWSFESRGFFYKRPGANGSGLAIAFAGGSVSILPVPIPKDLAIALLTVNGGERIDRAAIDRLLWPQLDYGKIYALATFVALSLLPGVRLLKWRYARAKL